MGTLMGTANFKYNNAPMGRPMGLPPDFLPPNGKQNSGPFKNEELFDEDRKHVRNRLLLGVQLGQAVSYQFLKNWIKVSISHFLLDN